MTRYEVPFCLYTDKKGLVMDYKIVTATSSEIAERMVVRILETSGYEDAGFIVSLAREYSDEEERL